MGTRRQAAESGTKLVKLVTPKRGKGNRVAVSEASPAATRSRRSSAVQSDSDGEPEKTPAKSKTPRSKKAKTKTKAKAPPTPSASEDEAEEEAAEESAAEESSDAPQPTPSSADGRAPAPPSDDGNDDESDDGFLKVEDGRKRNNRKAEQRKAKRARRHIVDAEEAALTDALFGTGAAAPAVFGRNLNEEDSEEESEEESDDAPEEMGNVSSSAAAGKPGNDDDDDDDDELGFVIDKAPKRVVLDASSSEDEAPMADADEDEESEAASGTAGQTATQRSAVWQDEDDGELTVPVADVAQRRKLRNSEAEENLAGGVYEERLREQFNRIHRQPEWVRKAAARKAAGKDINDSDSDSEDEAVEQLMRRTTSFKAKGGRLAPDELDVTRFKDANRQQPANASIQALQFHPTSQLLLTGGFDKSLRLFHVDGKKNAHVQSVFLADMPIRSANFTPDGNQVLISGRRKFFYVYDVAAGRVEKINGLIGRSEKSLERSFVSPDNKYFAFLGNDGYTMLASTQTRQWIGDLKMNGSVRSIAFSDDGTSMKSIGGDGDIYTWDLRTRRCIGRQVDSGTVHGTALAWASGAGVYATGSDAGVVNLYHGNDAKKPKKSIMNLTTEIDQIAFNHDAQLMAISSREKKDAMRVVHVASGRVFSNWPTAKTPLHYVSSLAFSPNSGFLAAGNDRGKVLLYRLMHYASA